MHSKCQSVFNEHSLSLSPPPRQSPSFSVANVVAICCENHNISWQEIRLWLGHWATTAATRQHRQCCGKHWDRKCGACRHGDNNKEMKLKPKTDAAMRATNWRPVSVFISISLYSWCCISSVADTEGDATVDGVYAKMLKGGINNVLGHMPSKTNCSG